MLNELAKECYENSLAHGFWDASSNTGEKIALMHSEISEAFEEYRAGHAIDEIYYSHDDSKPEGVGVELADCKIRILDFCGKHDIDLDGSILKYPLPTYKWQSCNNVGEFFAFMHSQLSRAFETYTQTWTMASLVIYLISCLFCIDYFCEKYGINLDALVKEKMAYNKTRPFMHNKVV